MADKDLILTLLEKTAYVYNLWAMYDEAVNSEEDCFTQELIEREHVWFGEGLVSVMDAVQSIADRYGIDLLEVIVKRGQEEGQEEQA